MTFYISIDVDNYKSRYSENEIIDSVCNGAINELTKMGVDAMITVSPNWVNKDIKS